MGFVSGSKDSVTMMTNVCDPQTPTHSSTNTADFTKHYRLGAELGRGGFGAVYEGFRLRDRLPVAVKFIPRDKVEDWGQVKK